MQWLKEEQMLVKQIMTTNVRYVNKNSSVLEAAKIMRDCAIGSIPVEDEDKLIGMITDRDITLRAVAEGKNINSMTVGECMHKGINYCYDDDDILDICHQMGELKVRRMPVLNREKKLVGIISLSDLAHSDINKQAVGEAYSRASVI